jgi:hypothetical protein
LEYGLVTQYNEEIPLRQLCKLLENYKITDVSAIHRLVWRAPPGGTVEPAQVDVSRVEGVSDEALAQLISCQEPLLTPLAVLSALLLTPAYIVAQELRTCLVAYLRYSIARRLQLAHTCWWQKLGLVMFKRLIRRMSRCTSVEEWLETVSSYLNGDCKAVEWQEAGVFIWRSARYMHYLYSVLQQQQPISEEQQLTCSKALHYYSNDMHKCTNKAVRAYILAGDAPPILKLLVLSFPLVTHRDKDTIIATHAFAETVRIQTAFVMATHWLDELSAFGHWREDDGDGLKQRINILLPKGTVEPRLSDVFTEISTELALLPAGPVPSHPRLTEASEATLCTHVSDAEHPDGADNGTSSGNGPQSAASVVALPSNAAGNLLHGMARQHLILHVSVAAPLHHGPSTSANVSCIAPLNLA